MKTFLKGLVLIGAAMVLIYAPKRPAVKAVATVPPLAVVAPVAPAKPTKPPVESPKCLPGYKPEMPCIPIDEIEKQMRKHPDGNSDKPEPVPFDPKLRTT